MSVVIHRKPPSVPTPIGEISFTDDGDRLVLQEGHIMEGTYEELTLPPRLQVRVVKHGDRVLSQTYVRLAPGDARDLAAALVEWADGVEA